MVKSNLNIAKKYADDILSGRINACKYIKQACKYFKDNLVRKDLFIDENEIDKVIRFINSLQLTEQVTPKNFTLEPFQTFIISNIYGFYYKSNKKRKHKYIYIEIPRKNGKSMLVNALALYHTIFDTDSQIVLSANSREQAKNVNFKQVKIYCDQIDKRKKYLKQLYSKVKCGSNELIVTASDSKRLDGLNCSVGIIDELHAAKNGDMYNVIKSSQGSRKNPLLIVITTAGDDIDSFCYKMREYNTEILSGVKTDDSQFSLIYTLDEGDDYTMEENWYKANPNLDVSVEKDFYVSEIVKAMNNPVETNGIKVKNFNVWLQNKGKEERYIDMEYIKSSMQKIDIREERFNSLDCWVGVDLGAVSDLTATATMIQLDEKLYFFINYYLPEYAHDSGVNLKQFKEWAQQGYISITGENGTDYKLITKDLIETSKDHFINQVSYDDWNSAQWAIDANEFGLFCIPYNQNLKKMNQPTKELARLIYNSNVVIQYNPVTEWMFNNVIIKEFNGNIKPDKSKNSNKIDGVISIITCLGGYLSSGRYTFNIN